MGCAPAGRAIRSRGRGAIIAQASAERPLSDSQNYFAVLMQPIKPPKESIPPGLGEIGRARLRPSRRINAAQKWRATGRLCSQPVYSDREEKISCFSDEPTQRSSSHRFRLDININLIFIYIHEDCHNGGVTDAFGANCPAAQAWRENDA
jgi:hypothetical protein